MAAGTSKRMGRPKKKAEADGKMPGFAIRGSKEWHAWVTELASFRRLRATDLIDQALVEYASQHGFTKAAPKR
jgi:hypothetical protein